jgi:RecA-family ATPase
MYMTAPKLEPGEQPDTDLRELQFKKSNYGPLSSSIALRYQRGLFLPEGGISNLDKAALEMKADEAFLVAARKLLGQGQDLSPQKTSHDYAPTLLARQPETKGLRKTDLTAAMQRLLEQDKLHIQTLRPGSTRERNVLSFKREDTEQHL